MGHGGGGEGGGGGGGWGGGTEIFWEKKIYISIK